MEENKYLKIYQDLLPEMINFGVFEAREKQFPFAELMKELILEMIKKPFNHHSITGLIQISKFGSSDDCITKYLGLLNISNPEYFKTNMLKIERESRGLSGAGKQAIHFDKLKQTGFENIRQLLVNVNNSKTFDNIVEAVIKFDSSNTPNVKFGMYSPWLTYLRPQECPILNSMGKSFYKKLGWDGENYVSFMLFVKNNLAEVAGYNMLLVDSSGWPQLQEKYFPGEIFPAFFSFDMESSLCNFWKDYKNFKEVDLSSIENWIFGSKTGFFGPANFCGYKKMDWETFLKNYNTDFESSNITKSKLTQKKNYNLNEVTKGPIYESWIAWLKENNIEISDEMNLFVSDDDSNEKTKISNVVLNKVLNLIDKMEFNATENSSNLSKAVLLISLMEYASQSIPWEYDEEVDVDINLLEEIFKSYCLKNKIRDENFIETLNNMLDDGFYSIFDENEKRLKKDALLKNVDIPQLTFLFNDNLHFIFELSNSHFILTDAIFKKLNRNLVLKTNLKYFLLGAYDKQQKHDYSAEWINEGKWEILYDDLDPVGEANFKKAKSMTVGDLVALKSKYVESDEFNNNRSVLKIKGIGKIKEISNDGKKISIDYSYKGPGFKIYDLSYMNTVEMVTNEKHIELIFNLQKDHMPIKTKETHMTKKKFNLNTVFYGPPGTGKTYEAIYRTLEILNDLPVGDKNDEKVRHESVLRFKKHQDEKRVLFLTFNQTYSYEEFIEGIRPDATNKEKLIYNIESGALKNFLNTDENVKMFSVGENISSDRSQYIVHEVTEDIVTLKQVAKADPSADRGLIYIPLTPLKEVWKYVQENKATIEDLTGAKNSDFKGDFSFDKYILGYRSEFRALLRALEAKSSKQASKYQGPKVLVIDEINRGNISHIFGELITLLEEDKRCGNINGVEVDLPYSKDKFILPNNLFVLGTMNTADKSVAPLDFALRRRFHFESFMPDSEKASSSWSIKEISKERFIRSFLALNEKIEILKGRDYSIGHSYFMKINSIEDLHEVIFQQIIPLLNEYFYEDWDSLKFVLGESFLFEHPSYKKFKNLPSGIGKVWKLNDFNYSGNINYLKFADAFMNIAHAVEDSESE